VDVLGRLVACAGGALVAACGLGVNGLQSDGLEGGTPGLDAGVDVGSSGGHDASAEAATGPDAPGVDVGTADGPADVVDATPQDGCVPKGPENCTNGIDDDCNGLTDCADPACSSAGYACVPPMPNGWSFVAFEPSSRPACPGGLMTKTLDVDPTDLTATAACACTCGVGSPPSCVTGNITTKAGPDNTCALGPVTYPANDGKCNTAMVAVQPFAQATPPGPTGGTCTAQTSQAVPTTGASQGEACQGEAAFGAGCSAGQVCALTPSPFAACVRHGGQIACAGGSGYTKPHAVGTLQDNRGCSPCTCAGAPTATCGPGTWTFYTSGNCTGTGVALTANGQCDPTNVTNNTPFASNELSATLTSASCGQPTAGPSPTGSVQLTGEDTICCE